MALTELADVQSDLDPRNLAINKVGIKDLKHPIRVLDASGEISHTIATVNMYVSLPAQAKGTHMSRFVAILNEYDQPFGVEGMQDFVEKVRVQLNAEDCVIELAFPFFVNKKAPITGVQSMMNYEVKLLCSSNSSHYTQRLVVQVPVTSLCPASKKMADYGAHSQRSHVVIDIDAAETIWINELIALAEGEASAALYALLKRQDEKYVTEHAYDHPKFVEDAVRDIALKLQAHSKIKSYKVSCENFESIHNHSAYAAIEGDGHAASLSR